MYDVRKAITLSEKQLEKLQQGEMAVQQCLDMHYVFIPGMEIWINVNLAEIEQRVRTPPAHGIRNAIEGLHIWDRPLDMLYAREGKKYELEQLTKEKTKDVADPNTRPEPDSITQPEQVIQQNSSQQPHPDQLQVQMLENLRLDDKQSINVSLSDEKSLKDFQDFYNYFVEVDAGRSLSLTGPFSLTGPTTPEGDSLDMARQHGEPNPDDIALFDEECAVLLAEGPFRRILDYHDITIGTRARKEAIDRVSALQGMSSRVEGEWRY